MNSAVASTRQVILLTSPERPFEHDSGRHSRAEPPNPYGQPEVGAS